MFRKLSLEYFGGLLGEFGFETQLNYGPLYYRQNEADIFHFVMPQIGRYGDYFDVMVFANSPRINEDFADRLRVGIDVPSDNNSYLSLESGVSWDYVKYKCKKEKDFIESSETKVIPALQQFGLPYLDGIQTLTDLAKTVHPQVAKNYKLPD
ncbi:MAG: hypothetical protein AAF498_00845 [Pseudomonadota bacterium]